MKLIGCLLLVSGWLLALAALVMLSSYPQRAAFIVAALGTEALGLVLLTRAYTARLKRLP